VVSRRTTLTSQRIRQQALTLADNATARIAPANTTDSTSRLATLDLAPTARFDLNDNALILDKADVLKVEELIARARNSGRAPWQGPGLTTGSATAITGLAALSNDRGDGQPVYPSFAGLDAGADAVLVKYTYNGDTNLSGLIDAEDYMRIDRGFLSHHGDLDIPGLPAIYANGDFNYDDQINIDDYFLIDVAYARQTDSLSTLPPVLMLAGAAAVPEPAVLTLGVIAVGFVASRRFRPLKRPGAGLKFCKSMRIVLNRACGLGLMMPADLCRSGRSHLSHLSP
jgi:hypothetical protein